MIEPFEYYEKEKLVRKGTPNIEEAKSLVIKAIERMDYIKNQEISEKSASFIFEDIYEAVREASQALMELKGYKPYSHETVIAFLRDFHKIETLDISSFDKFKILRNKCVYRGTKVSGQTCKESLDFLIKFLPKLKAIFEKTSKESL